MQWKPTYKKGQDHSNDLKLAYLKRLCLVLEHNLHTVLSQTYILKLLFYKSIFWQSTVRTIKVLD